MSRARPERRQHARSRWVPHKTHVAPRTIGMDFLRAFFGVCFSLGWAAVWSTLRQQLWVRCALQVGHQPHEARRALQALDKPIWMWKVQLHRNCGCSSQSLVFERRCARHRRSCHLAPTFLLLFEMQRLATVRYVFFAPLPLPAGLPTMQPPSHLMIQLPTAFSLATSCSSTFTRS